MANKFAKTLKDRAPSPTRPVEKATSSKHVGGYFDPAVAKQLRLLAAVEERTMTDLLAEALDMLFQSRGLPPLAQKPGEPQ